MRRIVPAVAVSIENDNVVGQVVSRTRAAGFDQLGTVERTLEPIDVKTIPPLWRPAGL